MYSFLADVVDTVHLAYIGFVIFGQLAIVVGAVLKWQWVRSIVFRVVHLLMICVVAFEAIIEFTCPLTTLGDYLREQAGQEVGADSFIGRWVRAMLFPEWDEKVFTPVYIGFAVLVILSFIVVPPRRKRAVAPG
jgi:hypothetical protein